jgi:DNA repair protein SbcD/Mre11
LKILHTSDWHLGKKLDNFSRHAEQIDVLSEICEISDQQNIDLVLIAGDSFDTFNPPVESVELFYKTIKKLSKNGKRPVIVIAGNHDSPDRIEAPDALALEDAIIFAGYPDIQIRKFKNEAGVELLKTEKGFIELKLPQYSYPVRIILCPYANQFRIKKFLGIENEEEELRNVLEKHWNYLSDNFCDKQGVNLFCGHLFFIDENGETPEEPDDEKPILHIGGSQAIYSKNIPSNIQYAALGHLHRKHIVSNEPCPLVYCGSPISYSFSEAGQKKFVSIAEIEPDKVALIDYSELIKGKSLVRQRFDDIEKAIAWLTANTDKLLELTIVSDDYLSANDRKRLYNCHENIISIIPETKKQDSTQFDKPGIDLNKNIKELFIEYFVSKHGQNPDKNLLDLFNEILSEEDRDIS